MAGKKLFSTQQLEPGEFHAGHGHNFLRLADGRVRHRWPEGEMYYASERWNEICEAVKLPELHSAIEVVPA